MQVAKLQPAEVVGMTRPEFAADDGRNRACIDLSDAMAAYLDDRFDTRAEVLYAGLDMVLTAADERHTDLVCADCGALQGSAESFCWQCQHDAFMDRARYEAAERGDGETQAAATDGGEPLLPDGDGWELSCQECGAGSDGPIWSRSRAADIVANHSCGTENVVVEPVGEQQAVADGGESA